MEFQFLPKLHNVDDGDSEGEIDGGDGGDCDGDSQDVVVCDDGDGGGGGGGGDDDDIKIWQ